jgi:hypothetical protein
VRQQVRLEYQAKLSRQISVRRQRHLNRVSLKKAGSARLQDPDRLVVRQTHQSKVAARLSKLNAGVRHRRPLVPVLVTVAALRSEGNRPATASLASHRLAQNLAKGEAEKSAVNPE